MYTLSGRGIFDYRPPIFFSAYDVILRDRSGFLPITCSSCVPFAETDLGFDIRFLASRNRVGLGRALRPWISVQIVEGKFGM